MKPQHYDGLLLVAGFLVCWEILYLLVGEDVVSAPADTLLRAVSLLKGRDDGAIWLDRLTRAALADEQGAALDGVLKTVATL